MIDPFENYESDIAELKIRERAASARIVVLKADNLDLLKEVSDVRALRECDLDENRRLREACRQTNKGVHRLRVRCDRQARKIKDLKDALIEAMAVHSARGGEIKQSWIEAFEGRRPTEKAT
jgi:hypothetical protein